MSQPLARALYPAHAAPTWREPFVVLYRRAEARLRAYANQLESCHRDGEDLYQEAALRMYRKYAQFEPGTDFVAWGRRVVYTVFCAKYRKRKRAERLRAQAPRSATWLSPSASGGNIEERYDRHLVEALFARLSPCLAGAFELRYRGWTYPEIAAELDVPVGTVKSRVWHARKLLREWYNELYTDL